MHYVIEGEGTTEIAGEAISWKPGDVFLALGGAEMVHSANNMAAALWVCRNEPQLNFENLEAPARGNSPTNLVHYTGTKIDRQIDLIYSFPRDEKEPGLALFFSSDKQ